MIIKDNPMYKDMPFVIPEDDLELNLSITLLIIVHLYKTSRDKNILDIERLNLYFFLLKNPHILNKLLINLSKKGIVLKSYESLSFKSERHNSELLYTNKILKYYIQVLISNNLVRAEYDEKIGFIFIPTKKADEYIILEGSYFERLNVFINKIKQINSTSISKINATIKNILNERL